jgi:hypothetical protein
MSTLEHRGVRFDYEHVFKRIEPGETIAAGGAALKWYEIAPASTPVPPRIRELARQALDEAELDLDGELGFVILHRCGKSFYFLIISTWRNDNELWETVWAKDGDDAVSFEPWPIGRGHRPTFCVWELGAVCHEQRAWSRYLRSARDAKAKDTYLGDSYAGLV